MSNRKRKQISLNKFILNSYKSKPHKQRGRENHQIKKLKIQQKREASFPQSESEKETFKTFLFAFLILPNVLIEIILQYSIRSIGYFRNVIDSFEQKYEPTTCPTYCMSDGRFLLRVINEEEQISILQGTYIPQVQLSSLNFKCAKKYSNFFFNMNPIYNLLVDVDTTFLYLACDYTIYILNLTLTADQNSSSSSFSSYDTPIIQSQYTLQIPENQLKWSSSQSPIYKYLNIFKVSAEDQCIYCSGPWSDNLCVFNIESGEFLHQFVSPYSLHQELRDFALDKETNNLYLTDVLNDRIWAIDKKTKQYNLKEDQEWRSSENEYDGKVNFLKLKYKLSTPISIILHGEFLYINNDNRGIEIYSTSLDTFGAWIKTLMENKIYYLKMYLMNNLLFVKCGRMHFGRIYVFQ